MKCGSKCFIVEMEVYGEKKENRVMARTPVAARKVVRLEYGKQAEILTVRKEK